VVERETLMPPLARICITAVAAGLWLLALEAAGEPPRAHEVVVDGHPLRVWEKAPEAPRARILLVHGRTWSTLPDFDLQVSGEDRSLMDGLVARDIAAFGVDLRGYGETPRDDSGWLTPERAVADVARVLEWLRARDPDRPRPYLFGWSYGAMVAQLVAQARPELVSGLVLFGYPVRPGIDDPVAGRDGEPPKEATTAEAADADFVLPGAISRDAVDAFVAAALEADPVRADWRRLEQWRRLDGAEVRVPTLLLEAYHDPLARDDVHAELFARLDTHDKAWVVIPGGDHAAFLERPRRYFLDHLALFMRPRH
ncbi:MAG: alpha/beta hydrolase, partial [Pseudomonadota bacterium]